MYNARVNRILPPRGFPASFIGTIVLSLSLSLAGPLGAVEEIPLLDLAEDAGQRSPTAGNWKSITGPLNWPLSARTSAQR